MADAGIDLSIRTDSSQAGAGVREVEEAIRRAGRTSEEASRRSTDATQRNLQLYREETRILDLRARGRNDIADALRAEVDIRRMGIRLERELHVSQEEGLRLARQRLAAERALAEETARRNAAGGAGGGPGGGPSPPGGGPGSGGQGGGSGGGGPPPSGGPPPRRGGPPPPGGPDRGRDLNDTYYVLQDLVQGGVGAVANQMPIILRLLGQYGASLAGAAAAVGGGVAIGYALTNPDGVKAKLVEFANKLDGTIGAFPTPSSIGNAFMTWLAKMDEGVKAMDASAEASEKAFKAYTVRRDQELARRTGDAEGGSARNRAAGQQASRESRDGENSRLENERERRMQLERLRLEGIQNVEERTKAINELDKKWLTEKAARTLKIAQSGFELTSAANAAAKAELDALEKRADKARLAAGASGTSPELERINAARGGLKEAAQMSAEALRAAAAARTQAQEGVRVAADGGKMIDQRAANEDAARSAEAAKKTADDFVSAAGVFGKAMIGIAEDIQKAGHAQNKAREDREKEMQILELRSRGQNRRADRLQRQSDIGSRADALENGPEKMDREKAMKEAEREYDLRNPSRRIRGAGFGGSRGGGRSATEFTGLDGSIGGGIDGTGGLDGLSRLNSRNRRVGDTADGKPAFAGLDGLDALQNQNRKIRGAGFKAERQNKEAEPKAGQQQAGGGGPLAAILNAISGVGRKVETLTSASRTIRR